MQQLAQSVIRIAYALPLIIIGGVMPYIIKIYASIYFADQNISPIVAIVYSIHVATTSELAIFLKKNVEMVILNVIPYFVFGYYLSKGDEYERMFINAGTAFCHMARSLANAIKEKTIYARYQQGGCPITEIPISRIVYIPEMVMTFAALIALNIFYHFGALRGIYDPTVHASSTAGLVYVYFPFQSIILLVILNIIYIYILGIIRLAIGVGRG